MLLTLLIIWIVTVLVVMLRRLRICRSLPGPPLRNLRTIVLGSIMDGSIPSISQRHRSFAKYQAQYGPILRLYQVFLRPIVFIGNFDLFPQWYHKADTDRSSMAFAAPRSTLGLQMGTEWAAHRRLVAGLFSVSSIDSFLPTIHAASAAMCELWRAEHGKEIDVNADLGAWSLDIFGRVACAHDFQGLALARSTGSPYHRAAKEILKGIVNHMMMGRFLWLKRGEMRRYRHALGLYRKAAADILDRLDAAGEGAPVAGEGPGGGEGAVAGEGAGAGEGPDAGDGEASRCLAGKLARLSSHEGARLSREEVVQEVIGLMLAGHETSSNTLTWVLHLLARHPTAQAAVRAEVATLDLHKASLKDLYDCPLLQGAIYESLRLHSTVPVVPKVFDFAATFGGHTVPARTKIIQNKLAIGQDASQFPNPAMFDPSRFARGEFGEHGARIMAFGLGPRACVGFRLAEAELLSGLAHVLRSFRVLPGSVAPVESLAVTLQPADGLRLVLEPL